jgi:hypothetical protein
MNPKYSLGIVFKKICHSGLNIFLDYDGIGIDFPDLFLNIVERSWRISQDLFSVIQ